jgi:hypothetical protein
MKGQARRLPAPTGKMPVLRQEKRKSFRKLVAVERLRFKLLDLWLIRFFAKRSSF